MKLEEDAWPIAPGARPSARVGLFGVSLLLHAALLRLFLLPRQPEPDRSVTHKVTDLVWIRTPIPARADQLLAPVLQLPARAGKPDKARSSVAARPLRRERPSVTPTTPTMPAQPDPSAAPMAEAVVALDPAAPVFDREAAMTTARRIATEGEPFRAGMAIAQAPARPTYAETKDEKLGRMIAGAKRSNCLGPNAGGSLLTPLMWLIDKKGSGCKF